MAFFLKNILHRQWWWTRFDWIEKHQRWLWAVFGAVAIGLLSYDAGRLVTRASLLTIVGDSQGSMDMPALLEHIKVTPGGRLILVGKSAAKFIDSTGKTWDLPSFGDHVNQDTLKQLRRQGVNVEGEISVDIAPVKTDPQDLLLSGLVTTGMRLSVLALFVIVIYFLFKAMHSQQGPRFRRITDANRPKIRLSDIAGMESTKKEVAEVIEYLRDASRFVAVGARPPKGVLLYGPPGNGKTMLAKSIAGEAAAFFLEQSASSFVQVYVGTGAQAIRKLFTEARQNRPCVIFIDEIDAIGSHRSSVGTDEHSHALNALLTEMDGFEDNTGIVVIAATNRMQILDSALIRPGRFDRKVLVPAPSKSDRFAILRKIASSLPFSPDVNWHQWSESTRGFSAADLAGLINEAAIEAARSNEKLITTLHLSQARDRVLLGSKDQHRRLSDKERNILAVHELGHATVRLLQGSSVEKVSIVPRGRALGVTVALPDDDQEEVLLQTKDDIAKELRVLLGGRAAEEVVMGFVTGGAESDLFQASDLARKTLLRFGTEKWGPYVPESPALRQDIESLASEWIRALYDETKSMVAQRQSEILALTTLLLEEEELAGSQLVSLEKP